MAKVFEKNRDSVKRLRYIRALEKFIYTVSTYINQHDEITLQSYREKVEKALTRLEKYEAVALYNQELNSMEQLAQKMKTADDGIEDIEKLKNELNYDLNQLEKSRNRKQYKKDKHKKSAFNEWE